MSSQPDKPAASRRIVCARCAKIKQACDGCFPCARCKRLDVACQPYVGGDAHGAVTREVLSKPARITRTHSGCVTCKKRKRKCDEARPKCGDCRRLCLDCKYATPRTATASPAAAAATPTGMATDTVTGLTTATATRSPYINVGDDQEAWSSQPLDAHVPPLDDAVEFQLGLLEDEGDASSWGDVADDWALMPLYHRALYTSESGSTPSPNSNLPLLMLSAAPDMATDQDKSLLNHYIKVVAGVLSRRDDHRPNPYLTKVLPMAFANQLVMDSVLALSANHWKKLQPTVWKRGTIHQTNALQSLAKLLPHIEHDSADAALAATLLLCMIELFDGTSSHWKFHLDGARRLLAAFKQKSTWLQNSEFRTFYRQLYHYLDSATTISTCHPPLLEAPKDAQPDEATVVPNSPRYDADDEESLYGVPKSLFHFVDKINSLAYQRKFRDDPVFENMFQTSATSLRKELEQWARDNTPAELPADWMSSSPDAATYHATRAFEQALQLRLHQIVNGYAIAHDKVRQCVSQILESVQEIRYGNPLESSLTFPLVMAGSSCDSEGERLTIRDRFLIMERTLGFRYIYTAHDLVERVWKEREIYRGTDKDVNWAAIRYFQIPGLALL